MMKKRRTVIISVLILLVVGVVVIGCSDLITGSEERGMQQITSVVNDCCSSKNGSGKNGTLHEIAETFRNFGTSELEIERNIKVISTLIDDIQNAVPND